MQPTISGNFLVPAPRPAITVHFGGIAEKVYTNIAGFFSAPSTIKTSDVINFLEPAYTLPKNNINRGVEFVTDNLNKNIDMLNGFKTLEANWDYSNAEPFDPVFIDSIIFMLPGLDKQPKIFPTARDSIQFEYYYENSDDYYLEFEIYKNKISVYVEKQGNYEEFTIMHEPHEINKVVSDFYGNTNS